MPVYDLPERSSNPRPRRLIVPLGTEPERASDASGKSPSPSRSGDSYGKGKGASAQAAAPRPTCSWRSSRDRWILSIGRWLLASGCEAPGLTGQAAAQALGAAFYAVLVKGVEGAPEWSGAPQGSRPWEWGQAHSPAKHSLRNNPDLTWGQAIAHEMNAAAAAAEPGGELIPVLAHDRRKDGHALLDPDLPKAMEPVFRKIGPRGHPLGSGLDALVVVRGLIEGGFKFLPGTFREGELEQLEAFGMKSDPELQVLWGITLAGVRKRRERLRKRMSQIVQFVEGGSMQEAPTVIERLAWVEERVRQHEERFREHDRQLGLVSDEEAESVVDTFLTEIQDEEA